RTRRNPRLLDALAGLRRRRCPDEKAERVPVRVGRQARHLEVVVDAAAEREDARRVAARRDDDRVPGGVAPDPRLLAAVGRIEEEAHHRAIVVDAARAGRAALHDLETTAERQSTGPRGILRE